MNLYVKVEDGQIVGHPFVEENLRQVFQVQAMADEIAAAHGYVRVVRMQVPVGSETTGPASYELREDGLAYEVIPTRELTQEEKVDAWVRRPRNHHLIISDWTQMPDAPLSAEKKAEWAAYRQALRDMTATYANIQDPAEIVPPEPPAK